MQAAVVHRLGDPPIYGEFPEPQAGPGESMIRVRAAPLTRTSKSRAAGTHYDSAASVPFVPGIDGVGRLPEGGRVYFAFPTPPFGSMAERAAVPTDHCVPLPEGLDDRTAAAIANPGISSWAALTERARLREGETVLVNGATGEAGRLAVRVARYLGAQKVIATGRDARALGVAAELGADVTISLLPDDAQLEERLREQFVEGVDVVLDYLWGTPAERLLVAAARGGRDSVPIRYVEIGSVAGASISLPSAVLRSSSLTLMGSGTGGIPRVRLLAIVAQLFQAAALKGWSIETRAVPLAEIASVWSREERGPRIVLTVE